MRAVCEYVWLGGNNEFRSKSRVITIEVPVQTTQQQSPAQLSVGDLPLWDYDGSSTGQATTENAEVILKPVAMFRDPFKGTGNCFLVWCETLRYNDDTPLDNSHRRWAEEVFNTADKDIGDEPWFGIEQEYFIMDNDTGKPLGYTENGSQGKHYCGVGGSNVYGRSIAEQHYHYCLTAGITMSGMNAEVAPGQWEYQVGPCVGIQSGDHLWMSRYILERVAELKGYNIVWDPKPLEGDWNGSGCHTNFSTKQMREGVNTKNCNKTGYECIIECIDKLMVNHSEHMNVYGSGNEMRMTGNHETASFNEFTYGVGNRGASVRIGNQTIKNKCGYFEDRRPSSNMDPYLVTGKLMETCCSKIH